MPSIESRLIRSIVNENIDELTTILNEIKADTEDDHTLAIHNSVKLIVTLNRLQHLQTICEMFPQCINKKIGIYLLCLAAKLGYLQAINYLVGIGVDINDTLAEGDCEGEDNEELNNVMAYAIYHQDNNFIDQLIKAIPSIDINMLNGLLQTPLIQAMQKQNDELVLLLINNDADIDMADDNGLTPLTLSIEEDQITITTILIDNKAKICPDDWNEDDISINEDDASIIEDDGNSDYNVTLDLDTLNAINNNNYSNAIYVATTSFRNNHLKLMLENDNVKLQLNDQILRIAIGKAILSENSEAIDLLLNEGAKLDELIISLLLRKEESEFRTQQLTNLDQQGLLNIHYLKQVLENENEFPDHLLTAYHGFNINNKDSENNTLLHYCAKLQKLGIFIKLSDLAKSNLLIQNINGENFLHCISNNKFSSVSRIQKDALKEAIEKQPSILIQQENKYKDTPAQNALTYHKISLLFFYINLEKDIGLLIPDNEQNTLLHNICNYANRKGSIETQLNLLNALINNRKDEIENFSSQGKNILHLAALEKSGALMKVALKAFPHLINKVDQDGNTPLLYAISLSSYEAMNVLISCDQLDVNALNNQHRTGIIEAVINADIEATQALLSHPNLKLTQVDNNNKNVFHYAAENNITIIFSHVLQRKYILNQTEQITLSTDICSASHNIEIYNKITEFNKLKQNYSINKDMNKQKFYKSFSFYYGSKNNGHVVVNGDPLHGQFEDITRRTGSFEDSENKLVAAISFIVSLETEDNSLPSTRINTTHLFIDAETHFNSVGSFIDKNGKEKFKEKLINRFKAAGNDDGIAVILQRYKSQQKKRKRDPSYQQAYNHTEQALYCQLEDSDFLDRLINRMETELSIKPGQKIYQIVLDIFSKLDMCENCATATHGIQKSYNYDGGFLKLFEEKLQSKGYRLPKKHPIRMLTRVSSREESKNATVEQKTANKNHEVGSIDLRNHDNFFICHRNNEFAGHNNHPVYHSKKGKNKELEEDIQVKRTRRK